MSFASKFAQLIETVHMLNSKQKYQEAITLLEEFQENNTIVNGKNIETFNTLLELNKSQLQNMEYQNTINQYSRHDLLINMYKNNQFNIDLFYTYADKYEKDFDDLDFAFFDKIFISTTIPLQTKILVYEVFCDNKTNYDFKFYNNNLKKKFEINPVNDNIIKLESSLKKTIEKKCHKNPSYIFLLNDMLKNYINENFPAITSTELNSMIDSSYQYVESAVNNPPPLNAKVRDNK
jgi:hypothetical protein